MQDVRKQGARRKNKIVTIPNAMSFVRILLIPLLVWLYSVKQQYGWTIAVLLLSGATDIIDGWIARRFDMMSDVGKVLDPIADKLTQGIVLLCLVAEFPQMAVLLIVLLLKETIMGISGLVVIKKTGVVYGAQWHGKLTTVLLYLTLCIHILWHDIPPAASLVMVAVCISLMLLSLILYGIRNRNQIQSGKAHGATFSTIIKER